MKPKAKQHGSGGFTLIELLTVIAIIGILVALTATVGAYVRAEANRRETQGNAEILAGAVDKFQQVFDAYPPDDADINQSGATLMRFLTGSDTLTDADCTAVFGPGSDLALFKNKIRDQVAPLVQGLTKKCYSGAGAPKDAWDKDMIYLKTRGLGGKLVIISAGPDHYFGQSIIATEPANAEADNIRSDSKK